MTATHIPEHVQRVADEIKLDSSVREVWLIGSQANDSATDDSDWDLLVRSDKDPWVRQRREANVDVLWSGPTGKTLCEGCAEVHMFNFASFEWKEDGGGTAEYLGQDSKHRADGVPYDAEEGFYRRVRLRARRL